MADGKTLYLLNELLIWTADLCSRHSSRALSHMHRSLTSCCPPVGGIVSSLEPISVKPGSTLSWFLLFQSHNALNCIPVCGLLSGSNLRLLQGASRGRQVQEDTCSLFWVISLGHLLRQHFLCQHCELYNSLSTLFMY